MRIRSVTATPVLTLALAAMVVLAGCSSSKSGDGSFAGATGTVSTAAPTNATTAPPTPASTTSAPTITPTTEPPTTLPPTTVPPTTTPSASASGGTTPHCEGGKVAAPTGAPYCFIVPSGFIGPGPATLDTAQWPVAVQLATGGEDDIIVTGVFFAQIDTNTLSDDVLSQANDLAVASVTGLKFDSDKGKLTKVPGGRNIEYHAIDPGTGTNIDMNFVFSGYTKLQVNCQSKTKESAVNAACKKVIDSVRLVSVKQ